MKNFPYSISFQNCKSMGFNSKVNFIFDIKSYGIKSRAFPNRTSASPWLYSCNDRIYVPTVRRK